MVIVGYTADIYGRAALEHGVAEAKRRATSLVVIRSTAGDSYVEAAFSHKTDMEPVDAYLADCGVEYTIEQPGGVFGADALLDAMERPDADVLVIGIRSRNPVGKLLLGSVSQQVILQCPKPVLAVKPPE